DGPVVVGDEGDDGLRCAAQGIHQVGLGGGVEGQRVETVNGGAVVALFVADMHGDYLSLVAWSSALAVSEVAARGIGYPRLCHPPGWPPGGNYRRRISAPRGSASGNGAAVRRRRQNNCVRPAR